MKILDSPGNGFKEKEIGLLNKWVKELNGSFEGKRILENIEKESKVSLEIWEKFLTNLILRLDAGDSCLDALKKAIEDNMLLQGPFAKDDPEYLSKLIRARSLFRYLNERDKLTYEDKEGEKKLCKWIEDRSLTIEDNFKNIKLQGDRPIIWATFSDEIDNLMSLNNKDVDDLCDRMGLLNFGKDDYVINLRYKFQKIKNIKVPTIIEGGANPAFQPCDDGDSCGYTLNLKSGDWGLPEVVHEPIKFHELESLTYLGRKENNPEPFWEKDNRSIQEESK